ncbi:MAG: hypothetical protein QNJ70_04685 [Xenococcaceae cyanobacterium MO_207.B15]|nr:hypothetical protein [Xenococcaceae cyanobacterium MO_207.B15]
MEFIKKINLEKSVNDALNQSVQELLPEEIKKNDLARWIMDFPGLGESNKDSDYKQQDFNSIAKIISNLSSREKKTTNPYKNFLYESIFNRENLVSNFLDIIIQNSLTSNISFYFSSLFHIGRQWQVSLQALETAKKALAQDHLAKTVEQNYLLLQDELIKLDISEKEHKSMLSDAFSEILIAAQKQHSTSLSQSQKWWSIWQEEVSELNKIVIEIDEKIVRYSNDNSFDNDKYYKEKKAPYRRNPWNDLFLNFIELTTFHFSEKSLYQEFLEAGITFKGIDLSALNQEYLILNNLAYLSLFSMLTNEKEFSETDLMIVFREYDHLIRELQKLQHKKRYERIDREVEEQLLRDFQKENPFEQYGVLKSPPDRYLLDLWNKCKLPSGETFYYAQNWLKSLESKLSFWNKELTFTSILTDEHIEGYASSIDSTIKREWVSSSKITSGDKAGRTDTNLIQELCEQECIVQLVKGAVYPSKLKKGEQKWNVDNFREMFETVIQFLNERGYNLETPSKARLERLWDLAIKGNVYRSTKW